MRMDFYLEFNKFCIDRIDCTQCLLSPGQAVATSQRNASQHCWPSICKLRQSDRHIWTQQIATLLGATCCTRLATLLQRVATTSCNIHKFDHFQIWANNTQHVATRRNMVAKRTQHVAPNNAAICCVEMLQSFGRGFILETSRHMHGLLTKPWGQDG